MTTYPGGYDPASFPEPFSNAVLEHASALLH
jgi:hypothetical protein